MNGEKLLVAMGLADERFVAEAEEERPARVVPMPALRWAAALAACFTVLVVWAVAVQCGKGAPLEGGASINSSAETARAKTGGALWLEGKENADAAEEAVTGGEEEGEAMESGAAETAEEPEPMPTAAPDSAFGATGPDAGDGGLNGTPAAALLPAQDVEGLRTQSGPATEPWSEYDAETAKTAAKLVGIMLSGEAVEEPESAAAPITLEFTFADGTVRTFRLVTDQTPGEGAGEAVDMRAFLEDSGGTWREAAFADALELELLLGYVVE